MSLNKKLSKNQKKTSFLSIFWSHFSIFFAFIAFSCPICSTEMKLEMLSPFYKFQKRGPSNFIPQDDLEILPVEEKDYISIIFAEDDAGVLKSIKNEFSSWDKERNYVESWSLESLGMHEVKGSDEKKKLLKDRVLKYLDKRLSGEIKRAEKGSRMERVGQIKKALHPKTETRIAPNIRIKIKGRVLQRQAIIDVINPFFDYKTYVNSRGDINMKAKREIAFLGVDSFVNYDVRNSNYEAIFNKGLSQNLNFRLSSSQKDDRAPFTRNGDTTVQFLYSRPF